jgi:hypothetical protein
MGKSWLAGPMTPVARRALKMATIEHFPGTLHYFLEATAKSNLVSESQL